MAIFHISPITNIVLMKITVCLGMVDDTREHKALLVVLSITWNDFFSVCCRLIYRICMQQRVNGLYKPRKRH